MNDNVGGWGEEAAPRENTLTSLPPSWENTEATSSPTSRVAHLISVAQRQITKLRCGDFSLAKTNEVAALMLETQMFLADFLAEAELASRQHKLEVQYVEGEVAAKLIKKAADDGQKRPSETALKREVSCADEIKKANQALLDSEREYKKYRYINDIIKEAHILFRNLER